jgi:hypothetical protein
MTKAIFSLNSVTGERRGTSSSVSPWMPGNSTGTLSTSSRKNWTSGGGIL